MLKKAIENKDFITIYTDGGCISNPNGKGGYGVVIFRNGQKEEFSQGFLSTTNNRMELRAFIRALEELKEPSNIILYTDSKYLCQTFNLGWIDNWLKTDWKKGTVKNIDLWKKLLELITDAVYICTDIDLYDVDNILQEMGIEMSEDELDEFEGKLLDAAEEIGDDYRDQIAYDAFIIFKELLGEKYKTPSYPEDAPGQMHLFELEDEKDE